jgi:hypothetical protein
VASIQTLERRIAAVEARLADNEGGYGDTLYHLRRPALSPNFASEKSSTTSTSTTSLKAMSIMS